MGDWTSKVAHSTAPCACDRGEMPGLVALVSRREDVHVEALGCAFVRRRTDEARCDLPHCLDDETLTAAAVMILVEECRLRLDDPVDEFLPFRCPICLWSQSMGAPFCKHERRVRVARLHKGAVRNLRSLPIGATAPSSPSSRSMLSRPYLEKRIRSSASRGLVASAIPREHEAASGRNEILSCRWDLEHRHAPQRFISSPIPSTTHDLRLGRG
jgi:hypothetical protein